MSLWSIIQTCEWIWCYRGMRLLFYNPVKGFDVLMFKHTNLWMNLISLWSGLLTCEWIWYHCGHSLFRSFWSHDCPAQQVWSSLTMPLLWIPPPQDRKIRRRRLATSPTSQEGWANWGNINALGFDKWTFNKVWKMARNRCHVNGHVPWNKTQLNICRPVKVGERGLTTVEPNYNGNGYEGEPDISQNIQSQGNFCHMISPFVTVNQVFQIPMGLLFEVLPYLPSA